MEHSQGSGNTAWALWIITGMPKCASVWSKTVFWREAVLIRTVLSDARWDRIKDPVPGKGSDRGVTSRNNRLFVEAVL
jgi:hypothetical protein